MAYSYCWCCGGTSYCTHRKYDSSGSLLWNADHGDDAWCIVGNPSGPLIVGGQVVVKNGEDDYSISLWGLDGQATGVTCNHGGTIADLATDSSGNIYCVGTHTDGMVVHVAQEGGVSDNEIQWVYGSGPPTAGTFTLTFVSQTTAAIAYNATAADVQSALEALSNIGVGDVSCTGGPLPNRGIIVEFTGSLSNTDVAAMVVDTSSLTFPVYTTRKWNSSGSLQWSATAETLFTTSSSRIEFGSQHTVTAIAVDASGNVLTGSRRGTLGGGDVLELYNSSGTRTLLFGDATISNGPKWVGFSGSDMIAYGNMRPGLDSPPQDGRSVYTVYDSSGNPILSEYFALGSAQNGAIGNGVTDSNGDFLFVGHDNTHEIELIDPSDGSRYWSQSFSDLNYAWGCDIDSSDNICLVGRNLSVGGGNEVKYCVYDGSPSSGVTVQWEKTHGKELRRCMFDGDGNVYVAGYRVEL